MQFLVVACHRDLWDRLLRRHEWTAEPHCQHRKSYDCHGHLAMRGGESRQGVTDSIPTSLHKIEPHNP